MLDAYSVPVRALQRQVLQKNLQSNRLGCEGQQGRLLTDQLDVDFLHTKSRAYTTPGAIECWHLYAETTLYPLERKEWVVITRNGLQSSTTKYTTNLTKRQRDVGTTTSPQTKVYMCKRDDTGALFVLFHRPRRMRQRKPPPNIRKSRSGKRNRVVRKRWRCLYKGRSA